MRLQTDQELIQNEIKDLNKKYIVQIFPTNVTGGKLAATQKSKRTKKRIFRFKNLNQRDKIWVKHTNIICKMTNNTNKTPEKYGIEPDRAEKEAYRLSLLE